MIFSPAKVDSLCEVVTTGCMKGLLTLNKPFKYAGKNY